MTRKRKPVPDQAKVLHIIASKGEFRVHKFRTGDRTIRARCLEMEKTGKIRVAKEWSDELVYVAQQPAAPHNPASSPEKDHAE